MLINSDDIKQTKQKIDVMQAFIDGKEIEFKDKFENDSYKTTYCPTWDFENYQYRIKNNKLRDYQIDKTEEESINQSNTEELFEAIYYCSIMEEFEFVKQLYKEEDLKNKKHLQKTGRSFIIDKETNKIIKVNSQSQR